MIRVVEQKQPASPLVYAVVETPWGVWTGYGGDAIECVAEALASVGLWLREVRPVLRGDAGGGA